MNMITIEEMVALYNNGKSYDEIAIIAKCSKKSVYNKLKGKITPRKAQARSKQIDIITYTNNVERDNIVIGLYKSGYGALVISKKLCIAKKTVYNILSKHDITCSKRSLRKLTDIQIADANKRYALGESIPSIAIGLHITESALRHHINNKRRPGDTLSSIPTEIHDDIIYLVKDKLWSSYQVADKYNLTPQSVQRFIKRNGLSIGVYTKAWKDSVQRGLSKPQSKLEVMVQETLDELSLAYNTQQELDPVRFDFSLNNNEVLLEVQGSYWHAKPERRQRDRFKSRLARKHKKKLVVVWDHELGNKKLIEARIINAVRSAEFNFKECIVKECSWQQSRQLLSEWHYQGCGRSGHCIAAFYDDNIVATCVFAKATRQETAAKQKLGYNEVFELTRFVIDPAYQAHNFGTWLLARAIRIIKSSYGNIKCLVAFADTTYGHYGDLYRAGNWKFDGECAPSYWYYHRRKNRTWHKKSIWNAAKKRGVSESDYATSKHLVKVIGQPKIRYIYHL